MKKFKIGFIMFFITSVVSFVAMCLLSYIASIIIPAYTVKSAMNIHFAAALGYATISGIFAAINE